MIRLTSYEDEHIKLNFDVNDDASIEFLNDPEMSDVKASLKKWKLIQRHLNDLVEEENDDE